MGSAKNNRIFSLNTYSIFVVIQASYYYICEILQYLCHTILKGGIFLLNKI